MQSMGSLKSKLFKIKESQPECDIIPDITIADPTPNSSNIPVFYANVKINIFPITVKWVIHLAIIHVGVRPPQCQNPEEDKIVKEWAKE